MVVGEVFLDVRIVWRALLVLLHIYTARTGYVAAFVEGGVGAGATGCGLVGAWREAVPACVFAVIAPAVRKAPAWVRLPEAIGAIAAVSWAILGTFLETVCRSFGSKTAFAARVRRTRDRVRMGMRYDVDVFMLARIVGLR